MDLRPARSGSQTSFDISPRLAHLVRVGSTAGDLSDLDALKNLVLHAKPDVVFHLAAQPLVRRSYQDPLGTWATNVMGSLHLLGALSLQQPCAVVMVTTDKVYENLEWTTSPIVWAATIS